MTETRTTASCKVWNTFSWSWGFFGFNYYQDFLTCKKHSIIVYYTWSLNFRLWKVISLKSMAWYSKAICKPLHSRNRRKHHPSSWEDFPKILFQSSLLIYLKQRQISSISDSPIYTTEEKSNIIVLEVSSCLNHNCKMLTVKSWRDIFTWKLFLLQQN